MKAVSLLFLLLLFAACGTLRIGAPNRERLFRATGQEPTWSLRIDGPKLIWVTNYGIDTFRIRLDDRNLIHRKNFDSISDRTEDLRIAIRPGGCKEGRDTGSHRVIIHYNSRSYTGCGQWVKKN